MRPAIVGWRTGDAVYRPRLLSTPKVLILDEPSQGLAPLIVKDVFRIVTDMRQEDITILLVEQNVRMALDIADTVYVPDHGLVTHHGPAAALAGDEALIQSLAGASAEKWDLDTMGSPADRAPDAPSGHRDPSLCGHGRP